MKDNTTVLIKKLLLMLVLSFLAGAAMETWLVGGEYLSPDGWLPLLCY